MLRGLTTVTYFADDLGAARDWYSDLLGIEAYFEREVGEELAYIEFRVGDYRHELGILNSRFAPHAIEGRAAGAVMYWAVDDVDAAFERLLSLGASEHDKPVERGPGFITASVIDPFGNVLGVMYNQHFLDVLAENRAA